MELFPVLTTRKKLMRLFGTHRFCLNSSSVVSPLTNMLQAHVIGCHLFVNRLCFGASKFLFTGTFKTTGGRCDIPGLEPWGDKPVVYFSRKFNKH